MSASASPPPPSAPVPPTKRKRTGKQRQLAKEAAIAAAAAAAAAPQNAAPVQHEPRHEDNDREREDDEDDGSRKRRRVDVPDGSVAQEIVEENVPAQVDMELVEQRVPQALKSLHTILKKAKTVETQRLIKKVKFLRTRPEGQQADLKDLESQLESLKHFPLQTLPPCLLLLKLRKHPLLRHTALPPTLVPTAASTSTTQPIHAKLENRLYSSKGVGEEVKRVVGWVVGEESAKLKRGKHNVSVKVEARVVAVGQHGKQDKIVKRERVEEVREENAQDLVNELERREEMAADAAGWESGSLGGDDDGDDVRLAASSGEDSDEDSDEEDTPPPAKRARAPASAPVKKGITSMPGTTKAPNKTITSSLFLPSLSAGYTLGDGDSDFSDPEEDDRRDARKGGGVAPERKNRRGQRERKAIWEKKYGQNANHVKKQREEEKRQEMANKFMGTQTGRPVGKGVVVADSGWGPKRGPTVHQTKPWGVKPAATPAPPPPPADEKPKAMHPSWEAARLRKQKEMALAGGAGAGDAPKPKKIVFD